MTIEDLKKLDKQLRQIQDPFGTGFQVQGKLWKLYARRNKVTVCEVRRQYNAWKLKK